MGVFIILIIRYNWTVLLNSFFNVGYISSALLTGLISISGIWIRGILKWRWIQCTSSFVLRRRFMFSTTVCSERHLIISWYSVTFSKTISYSVSSLSLYKIGSGSSVPYPHFSDDRKRGYNHWGLHNVSTILRPDPVDN